MRTSHTIPILLLAVPLLAGGCSQQTHGSQAPAEAEAVWQLLSGSEERVVIGDLTDVNLDAQAVIVKVGRFDEAFAYDDRTVVLGSQKWIQGLVGLPATPVLVHYRHDGAARRAVRIEVR